MATISSNQITLQGQPVRTIQSFSGPLAINFDVLLPAKTTPDGFLFLAYIPVGLPTNLTFTGSATSFAMCYAADGTSSLLVNQGPQNAVTEVWYSTAFTLAVNQSYHVTMNLSAGATPSVSIDGQPYSLPSSASVSLSQYQLEFYGWQPNDTWYVRNFTVVPEPATVTLVGLSLIGLLRVAKRRHRLGV